MRTRAHELKESRALKTVQRYFNIEETYPDPDDPNAMVTEERYGEVTEIMVLDLGDKSYTLIGANWFKHQAVKIHVPTQTPRVNKSLVFDRSSEDIIEADVVKSQVVITDLPYRGDTFMTRRGQTVVTPPEMIVLDRKFDTLSIGGAT